MRELIKRFGRVFVRCWVVAGAGVWALLWALGMRGEPLQWTNGHTWLALAYLTAMAAFISTVPALLLAALVSAATFRARHTPPPER